MLGNDPFPLRFNRLGMTHRHLDMVGVVGSSPIVPTKQNPSSAGLRGRSEGVAFFVLGILWENFGKTRHPIQSFSPAWTCW